jgi:hypothetical protein
MTSSRCYRKVHMAKEAVSMRKGRDEHYQFIKSHAVEAQ